MISFCCIPFLLFFDIAGKINAALHIIIVAEICLRKE